MSGKEQQARVFWRGACEAIEAPAELPNADHPQRIFLAIESDGNRKQLLEHLSHKHEIVSEAGGSLPGEPFDVAVLDTGGFARWHRHLTVAKTREQPVFLPVMLILPRAELARELHPYLHVIDEFLVSPIDRRELDQRVAMVLRARRLALTQRSHLAYLVHHDRVTGLPSKTLFLDRLSQAVQDATVLNQRVYVIVVHIALTSVLKSLGTRGLEEAAAACAEKLKTLLREEFSLARFTTEQWGLMLRTGASVEEALDKCRRVQALGDAPIDVNGERVHVSPRIGVAVYPEDASNADSLLDRALAAISDGDEKASPVFYSPIVQHQALRYIRTEARLHEALAGNQLELWLQPKVALNGKHVTGAEALVRWRLPNGELVSPADFIPVAEATGFVTQIDLWMIERSCEALYQWRSRDEGPPKIAVNISVQHLDSADFVSAVCETLSRYDLPATALELELTETASANLSPASLQRLQALRAHGISIALDDFGTGYCSLSYLHTLPITTLKIDRSFVKDLPHDESSVAITQTVVSLARNFGLEVVAEGVEDHAQAEYLGSLNVEIGQGFLWGRPMPEPEFRIWLREYEAAAEVSLPLQFAGVSPPSS